MEIIPRNRNALFEKKIQQEIQRQRRNFRILTATFFLFIVLAVATGVFFYWQKNQGSREDNQEEVLQKEREEIITTLGAFIELPENEVPTLATVTDKQKLGDQEFFKPAEEGDKILIYADSRKAILYRPSTQKVIAMTIINDVVAEEETLPKNSIALYEGGGSADTLSEINKNIQEQFSDYSVIASAQASKQDYSGVVVVDLTDQKSLEVARLAEVIGGTIGDFPEGENIPNAEILIIVGK